ncbi:MAG: ribosome small subunit-dependent GTPase A [Thermoleophilia bacterium]
MTPAAAAPAQVVRVAGPTASVRVGGREVEARLAPRLPGRPLVAGDRVELDDADGWSVTRILPRSSRLDRADGPGRRPRPLVANADLLIVVAAVVRPPLRPRLIDRYLVAAWVGHLDAAIAVTKADLPHDAAALDEVVGRYRDIGYPVLVGASHDPSMHEALRRLIDGRVAILAGHSGVGKSTLTAALTGVERAVGAVSEKAGTGRHTTTDPRLIPLPGPGAVVDTAGVRTFHLPRIDREALEAAFPEIARLAPECRFRGCAHDGDAGCAVAGRVSEERLDSYRRMLADLR